MSIRAIDDLVSLDLARRSWSDAGTRYSSILRLLCAQVDSLFAPANHFVKFAPEDIPYGKKREFAFTVLVLACPC